MLNSDAISVSLCGRTRCTFDVRRFRCAVSVMPAAGLCQHFSRTEVLFVHLAKSVTATLLRVTLAAPLPKLSPLNHLYNSPRQQTCPAERSPRTAGG